MPKFSVIVPIYKVEKFIKQCIQSILNQTYKDFEVICVDDCGKDNSMKIVAKMAEKDNRIIILHHEHNKGLSAARNTGFEIAKGEYTLFVDSDDWLEKNCLEVIEKTFRENDVNSVLFDAYKYDDNKHKREEEPILKHDTLGILSFSPISLPLGSDYAWIKAYKTSAIREKNLKFPEGLTFEDGEFYFKFFSLYPRTFVLKDCLYNYRVRENSIVTNAQKGNVKLEDIYQVLKNVREFYKKEGLYDQYKLSLAIILHLRINSCKEVHKNYIKSMRLSNEILQEFGTIEEFREYEMNNFPLVSVIAAIHNDSENIYNCMSSIQNQNYTNLEILCVYDEMNKNSKKILEELKQNDKRIRIIENKNNNLYKAGFDSATGKYVLFVNSNDKIEQNYITAAAKILNNSNYNFVVFKNTKEPSEIQNGRIKIDDSTLSKIQTDFHNIIFDRIFLTKNNLLADQKMQEMTFKAFINSKEGYFINENFYSYNTELNEITFGVFDELKSLYDYIKEKNLSDTFKKSFLSFVINNVHLLQKYRLFDTNNYEVFQNFINYINFNEEYKQRTKV